MILIGRFKWLALCLVVIAGAMARTYEGWGETDPGWTDPLSYPGREAARRVDPSGFASAETCAGCHPQHYAEWRTSAMGRSVELSGFLYDLFEASLDVRGAPRDNLTWCLRCHAPVAALGPTPDHALTRPTSREGVTCDVCHTAAAAHADASPGGLEWDSGGTKRGPIRAPLETGHPGAYSGLHESSDLCGTCHLSTWPGNGLPVDWTYAEWREGPSGARGETCQACHMPTYRGSAAPGAPVRTLHRHTFRGASDEAFVRSAARLEVEVRPREGDVLVTVVNHSGHSFPTGNANFPELRLCVRAMNAEGRTVLWEDRIFRLDFEDARGEPARFVEMAVRERADTRLRAGERRQERFRIPSERRPVEVRVSLVYWRWREDVVRGDGLGELGPYLRNGVEVHRLLARLPDLGADSFARVRALAPIIIDDQRRAVGGTLVSSPGPQTARGTLR